MPEDDIPSRKTKSQRLLDFMSPSERVLRVHRKNFACARALRLQMEEYDVECRRALRKVEQEIFEVYFDEYLPLKAQARSTAHNLQHLNRVNYTPNIHTRKSRANVKFPIIKEGSNLVYPDKKIERNPEAIVSREGLSSVISQVHLCNLGGRPSPESRTSSPILEAAVTAERLRIIASAVALTSQPPPPALKRKKKKDRSPKIPTITITEVSGEEESRRESIYRKESSKTLEGTELESQDRPVSVCSTGVPKTHFPSTLVKSLIRWRPSLDRNRIFNDEETDTGMERSKSELEADPVETPGMMDKPPWKSSFSSLPSEATETRRVSEVSTVSQYESNLSSSSGLTSPDVGLDIDYEHDFNDEGLSSYYSYSSYGSDEGL